MRAEFIMRSVLRQILCRRKAFLFSCVLISMAFLVIGGEAIIVGTVYYQKYIVKKMLRQNIDNVYYLDFSKYKMPDWNTQHRLTGFANKMKEVKGIKYAGVYLSSEVDMNGEYIPVFLISKELLQLCDLKNINGKEIAFKNQGGRQAALVGYNLKDQYPIGYEFEDGMTKGKYVVTDVLDKNSKWLKDNIQFLDLYENLDNYIVADANVGLQNERIYLTGIQSFCFVPQDSDEMERVRNDYYSLAKDFGLDIYNAVNLSYKLETNNRDLFKDPEVIYMAVAMLVIAALGVMTSSMIGIYIRKSSIGTMLAIGYTQEDIKKIVIIENSLKIWISFVIAYAYWSVHERELFDADISILQVILPWLLLGAALIIGISSTLPILQLGRMCPALLIGDKGK